MKLIAMSAADYQAFAARSVAGYARDIARTYGLADALAFKSASADFNELLADGLETKGHHFYRLCIGDNVEVGSLWIGVVENPP